MEGERRLEILGGRPQGVVIGQVIGPVGARIGRDHAAREARGDAALQLGDRPGDVVGIEQCDALEGVRVGGAELGDQPVVARLETGLAQIAVDDAVDARAERREDDLTRDAVAREIGQARPGIGAARPDVGPGALEGHLFRVLEAHASLRRRTDRAERRAAIDREMDDTAVVGVRAWRPLSERRVDMARPEVGRLDDM